MSFLGVWFRFVILQIVLSLWVCFFVLLFTINVHLLWIAPAISLLVTFLLSTQSERILARLFRAVPEPYRGLTQNRSRVLMMPEATPNLVVVRSALGRGTILFSRGLVALLDESELAVILKSARKEARRPGLRLQSVCAVFGTLLLACAPSGWTKFFLSGEQMLDKREEWDFSVSHFVWFAVLIPWIRFFFWIGRIKKVGSFLEKLPVADGRPNAWRHALLKIKNSQFYESGMMEHPGTYFLHLFDPMPVKHPFFWDPHFS